VSIVLGILVLDTHVFHAHTKTSSTRVLIGILHLVPSIEKLHVKTPEPHWKHPEEKDKTRGWIWNDTLWIETI